MRSISDEFQSELHSGTLKWVTDAVKDRTNDLILCFRDCYVNVYYKSHSLFEITQNRQGYRLSFNLRHARYTEPMEAAKSRIKAILPEIRFSASDEAWFSADMIPQKAQAQIIAAYKSYIDDFFDPSKLTDYIHKSPKPLIQSVSDFYFFLTEKPCKTKSSGNRGFKVSLLLPELFCFPEKIIYFYVFQMNPLPRNNLIVWGII